MISFLPLVQPEWISKVLASLEAKVKESKEKPEVAFAVSAQYKSNFDEGESNDGDENLNGSKVETGSHATIKCKGGRRQKKKKGKKKPLLTGHPSVQTVAPSQNHIAESGSPPLVEMADPTDSSIYQAGKYNGERLNFVQDFIDHAKNQGAPATRAAAHAAWNSSLKRAQLLAGLSVSELKRRRFIPKGTWENPFKATVEASLAG